MAYEQRSAVRYDYALRLRPDAHVLEALPTIQLLPRQEQQQLLLLPRIGDGRSMQQQQQQQQQHLHLLR